VSQVPTDTSQDDVFFDAMAFEVDHKGTCSTIRWARSLPKSEFSLLTQQSPFGRDRLRADQHVRPLQPPFCPTATVKSPSSLRSARAASLPSAVSSLKACATPARQG
jgi:hypothetical protein